MVERKRVWRGTGVEKVRVIEAAVIWNLVNIKLR